MATTHYTKNNLTKSWSYKASFNDVHGWIVEWAPAYYGIWLDGIQAAYTTDKAIIPTTPHHFVTQTDMGSWAGKPTSKDPTRIEVALNYVKQWKYVG